MERVNVYEYGCINRDGGFSVQYRGESIDKVCPRMTGEKSVMVYCNASCAMFRDPFLFSLNGVKGATVAVCGHEFHFKRFNDFRFETEPGAKSLLDGD